jgi:hypothetical protein
LKIGNKELDAIRVVLYEETKGLNDQEFDDYIGNIIDPIVEQFGFKYASSTVKKKPKDGHKKNS